MEKLSHPLAWLQHTDAIQAWLFPCLQRKSGKGKAKEKRGQAKNSGKAGTGKKSKNRKITKIANQSTIVD
jgi:hypothetical protein